MEMKGRIKVEVLTYMLPKHLLAITPFQFAEPGIVVPLEMIRLAQQVEAVKLVEDFKLREVTCSVLRWGFGHPRCKARAEGAVLRDECWGDCALVSNGKRGGVSGGSKREG